MNVQNDLQVIPQVAGPTEVSGAKPPASQSSGEALDKTDEPHLSTASHLVSQALALPEVRAEKIASIQSALASGSYQVSSSDVAAKMIDHLQLNHE